MANYKEVFTVCPRGEGKKDFWLRVGTCFTTRDGSFSIILDALPVNGKLIVREPREQQDDAPPPAQRRQQQRAQASQNWGNDGGNDDIPF